jgi:tRNA modification GTPase
VRSLFEPTHIPDRAEILDAGALVIYFPAPRTVTGEDVLEFHVHGGPAIVKAVLAAIPRTYAVLNEGQSNKCYSIRYAEPGEFTRRAFYNGRLHLPQIEALGDSLSAETEQQRRLAVNGTQNALTKRYHKWRDQLLYARGELEALIDFSEDQHFAESPEGLVASVGEQVKTLSTQLQTSISNSSRGELLRKGIRIAFLGAPNAGKSSLVNLIVGRDAAIVSEEAGTTRDVLEFNVDIGGYLCLFGDLAGLRANTHSGTPNGSKIGMVEQEGISRAKQWIREADVILTVLPVEDDRPAQPRLAVSVSPEVMATLSECTTAKQKIIYVINKIDLAALAETPDIDVSAVQKLLDSRNFPKEHHNIQLYRISCKAARDSPRTLLDEGGIQTLLCGLITTFKSMTDVDYGEDGLLVDKSFWEQSLGASERQRSLLEKCGDHLNEFLTMTAQIGFPHGIDESGPRLDIVIAAESLRAAAECLAKITGSGESGDVEEVLGVVFEK